MTDAELRQHLKDKLAAATCSREAQEWAAALHTFEMAVGTNLDNVLELVNG
jgi:crotonobetainyl-CoA:carnitine CoA-transferase CaiB-like acyl-CoA transferase